MADGIAIGSMISGASSILLNTTVWLVFGIVILAIVVGAIYLIRKEKKYSEFQVTILGKDGFGHPIISYDKGGVFEDSVTRNLRLYLKKNDVGLSADNIPYIQDSSGAKQIWLVKSGRKNFRYLNFNIDNEFFNIKVGEEDVNWAVNTYERQKKIFANQGIMPYLPYILLAFVSLVILIIFIYFFKDFGVLKDMASELHQAVIAMQQLKAGQIVI